MTRLTKQKTKLEELLSGVNAFNAKGKAAEIGAFLDKYIPAVEQMHTTLKSTIRRSRSRLPKIKS